MPESPRIESLQRESICDTWNELVILARAHWDEVAAPLFPAQAFGLDRGYYDAAETAGMFRLYTARSPDWSLVGYASYVVNGDAHARSSLNAQQDALYVLPEWRTRGTGWRLLRYALDRLRVDAVQVVHQFTTPSRDFGDVLTRLGFRPTATHYTLTLEAPCPSPSP